MALPIKLVLQWTPWTIIETQGGFVDLTNDVTSVGSFIVLRFNNVKPFM